MNPVPALSLVGAAVALFGLTGIATPEPIQDDLPAESDIADGEAVYLSYGCYGCHGYSGQNGPGTRLVGSPRMSNVTVFIQYVRNPSRMPAYSADVISDEQLRDAYAFVRTLEASPEAEDIPLLLELIEEQ